MADDFDAGPEPVDDEWPLRPWLLAAIGAIAGLVISLIFASEGENAWGAGVAAFAFFAAIAAGFTFDEEGIGEAAIFSLSLGVVMGGIAYFAADWNEHRAATEFTFSAGVFFSILAIPLFQSDFHRRRWTTPYAETHFHVWTDAVSAGGAFAFVLLSWALLGLLHLLFSIVGIEAIGDIVDMDGFVGLFTGATFGAALGVLRNQLRIIGTLQRVVMVIFTLLAVPFAAAILIFLTVLLFSGGNALWEATDSATPVLLACAVGCFVLANAVVRDTDKERSDNPAMLAAALVLAASIFPLTVFAAISMGIRIDQHGLSPERLWALVAIVIATAYGLAYWVGLARGRIEGWSHYLRRANLHLAGASCGVALELALPILDFGAISTRDQVARLQSGEVPPSEFDFDALRWDFGDAGRVALERLAGQGGDIGERAQAMLDREERYPVMGETRFSGEAEVRFDFDDAELRGWVATRVDQQPWLCEPDCVALDLGQDGDRRGVALVSRNGVNQLSFRDDGVPDPPPAPEIGVPQDTPLTPGNVKIREWTGRQVYVDGKPVGQPFE
ncbi:MAG: DUF4153 domain-containing protein [Alteraurantiacibacter sp.]